MGCVLVVLMSVVSSEIILDRKNNAIMNLVSKSLAARLRETEQSDVVTVMVVESAVMMTVVVVAVKKTNPTESNRMKVAYV